MNIEKIEHKAIALVSGNEVIIDSPQSALDFIMSVNYETGGYHAIILHKENIAEDFFDLKTGLAGEVIQKFINYKFKVAIIGDYSGYASKSLRDFIYESNRGKDIFFVSSLEAAIERLSEYA